MITVNKKYTEKFFRFEKDTRVKRLSIDKADQYVKGGLFKEYVLSFYR